MKLVKQYIGQRSPLRLAYHHGRAFLAALRYGFPARKLTIIGVTGTDGKTTTVGMTAHILHEVGLKTGALSTAFFRIGETMEWNETQKTSPSPFVIQKFLRRLADEGCTHAVLECSSHGLVQGRVNHTWPTVAAITNISPEHLDYHGTMDQYRKDKGILFRKLRANGTKVLNALDSTYDLYRTYGSRQTFLYGNAMPEVDERGTSEFSFWVEDTQLSTMNSQTTVCWQADSPAETLKKSLNLPIPGAFNIDNALCAISCAKACDVAFDDCVRALESFTGMPGRMERIDGGQDFAVYVDFTVTPGAYEKTLNTLRDMLPSDGKLLVLTGSCGDRMKEKRPQVGKICSELADIVVVTNEDPYTEDPQQIIDEVWAGVDQDQCQAEQIFDRREAMQWLFKQASSGDIVILCAKGSDTTMWTAEGQIPWNEREIAKELLRNS